MYEVVVVVDRALFLLNWCCDIMEICWSFVMVLVLTLTALVAPTQPLFQPPPARPHDRMHARDGHPEGKIEQRIPLPDLVDSLDVERSWNVLVGRRGRFRRLFQQHDSDVVCDAQLKCQKRKTTLDTSPRPPLDKERSQTREILNNYRLPPMRTAQLQSDRMVPTGPNPLHNSNNSQVILP